MAKGGAHKGSGKNTVVIKKKGATGGVNPGGGNPGIKPYLAQPMSGATDPVGQIPKKRRVIGQGEH